jgi:hypothetical protein
MNGVHSMCVYVEDTRKKNERQELHIRKRWIYSYCFLFIFHMFLANRWNFLAQDYEK